MKKILIALPFLFFSISVFATPAVVIKGDGGCTVLDGNGNIVAANGFHYVQTNNKNGTKMFQCRGKGLANDTGKAVQYDYENTGYQCFVSGQTTYDWHSNVSASGNVTLTCNLED